MADKVEDKQLAANVEIAARELKAAIKAAQAANLHVALTDDFDDFLLGNCGELSVRITRHLL